MHIEPVFNHAPVSVGVDLGFNSTKVAFRSGEELVKVGFPSVAIPLNGGFDTTLEGISTSNSDLKINVGGTVYQVDTNCDGEVPGSVLRNENDNFPLTDEHAALLFAALVLTGHRLIDELVLGLPFNTFDRHADQLRRRFQGTHEFGYGIFTIRNVSVLPQPIGSFTYVNRMQPGILVPGTSRCVVDVGWGTSDVFVCSERLKVDPSRCDGVPSGGAAAVVREVARLLRSEYGGQFTDLDRIDRAILTRQSLPFAGTRIDLSEFVKRAAHVTVQVTRAILTRIRTAEDLTVLVTGGGARYYLPAIQETLGCRATVVDDPRFANSAGFLFAGESAARLRK